MKSPFRIAVINDEITQDFARACEIVAQFPATGTLTGCKM